MSRLALGLAAILLALTTTACDDDPEPRIADPTSEATSDPTSEPPTSEPSPEPVALTPEETVRAWLAGLDRAVLEGDFADVEQLSAPDCKTCRQFIDPVQKTYDKGGSYRTKATKIAALKAKPNRPLIVNAAIVIPGGTLTASANAQPTPFDPTREILEFRVGRTTDGADVVSSVVFLS